MATIGDQNEHLLPDEWAKPQLLLLDNEIGEVKTLISHLSSLKYRVTYTQDLSAFLMACQTRVYPIQLIDCSLSRQGDLEGLEAAKSSAACFPDALRVLMSRYLTGVYANGLIEYLNPLKAEDTPLSLTGSLGTRIIWAISKKDEFAHLRQVITDYRNTIGCGDNVSIYCDSLLYKDITSGFSSLGWGASFEVFDPQLQFVEIVRQLARRSGMPTPRRIRLSKLGKGRSKTVVAHMRIEYSYPDEALNGPTPHHLDSIVKIGRLESIKRETRNYGTIVPQVFGTAFYPNLESRGVSRQLAGVAYSCLSDGDLSVAPTLLDATYGKVETINPKDALTFIPKAFQHLRGKSVRLMSTGGDRQDHGLLLRCYEERFRELKNREQLATTLKEANKAIQHIVTARKDKTPLWVAFQSCNGDLDLLTKSSTWEDYHIGLGHGDLHLDNIRLARQHQSWTNFYIDFADVGEQPVMLDFVVMDAALRFQSLKFLPEVPSEKVPSVVKMLFSLEAAVLSQQAEWHPAEKSLSPAIRQWMSTTFDAAAAIRKEMLSYLNDYLHGQGCDAEEELHRYYCGLGLASLSAMHLPQETSQEIHQMWFAYVAQSYLSLFETWRGGTESR